MEKLKEMLGYIVVIVLIILIAYWSLNKKPNKNSISISDTDKIYELEQQLEILKEENNKLDGSIYELNKELQNANDYIEELQQLLEDNGIDESDHSDLKLTDGSSIIN